MGSQQHLFEGIGQVVPKAERPKACYRQYGGKGSFAGWVVSHFPKHQLYVEPFCGSCAVLFAKRPSEIEIVNDLDGRIIGMYEVIRSRPKELAALLWATPYSPENWRREVFPEDELEDARLLMAQGVQYYCGNGRSSTWAIDTATVEGKRGTTKATTWGNWFSRVYPAAARLKNVQVLNEDALRVIERVVDKDHTLVYADPPYLGHEKEYRFGVEYDELVTLLGRCKGKVVVSEFPEAAHKYEGWRAVSRTRMGTGGTGVGAQVGREKTEFLFCNF